MINLLFVIIFCICIAALVISCLSFIKPAKLTKPATAPLDTCNSPCPQTCNDYITKVCGPKCPPHPPPLGTDEDHQCWTECMMEELGPPPDFKNMQKFMDQGCRPQCDLLGYDPSTGDPVPHGGPCKCTGWCF